MKLPDKKEMRPPTSPRVGVSKVAMSNRRQRSLLNSIQKSPILVNQDSSASRRRRPQIISIHGNFRRIAKAKKALFAGEEFEVSAEVCGLYVQI